MGVELSLVRAKIRRLSPNLGMMSPGDTYTRQARVGLQFSPDLA
ncbi:hypothetical protein A2U01_0109948, partial [Trifolium medium]|nr:hypothetical protein [Trifolium medium]